MMGYQKVSVFQVRNPDYGFSLCIRKIPSLLLCGHWLVDIAAARHTSAFYFSTDTQNYVQNSKVPLQFTRTPALSRVVSRTRNPEMAHSNVQN